MTLQKSNSLRALGRTTSVAGTLALLMVMHTAACSDTDDGVSNGDGGTSQVGGSDAGGSDAGGSDVGGSGGAAVGGSGGGSAGIPVEEWFDATVAMRCEAQDCFPLHGFFGDSYTSVQQCKDNYGVANSGVPPLVHAGMDDIMAGVAAGRIDYDPLAAEACVSKYKLLQCNDQINKKNFSFYAPELMVDECDQMFTGKVALGDLCYSNRDCAGAVVSASCATAPDSCGGVCTAKAAQGDACDPTGFDCATSDYCDASEKICKARVADAAACTAPPDDIYNWANSPCPVGHQCLNGACGAPPASVATGADCWVNTQCPANNSCERDGMDGPWKCLAFLAEGDTCITNFAVGAECGEGLRCTVDQDTKAQTCEKPAFQIAWAKPGEACGSPDPDNNAFRICQGSALGINHCDNSVAKPICVVNGGAGDYCGSPANNAGHGCQRGLYCKNSECVVRQPGGATCTVNGECLSDTCGDDKKCTLQCVAP